MNNFDKITKELKFNSSGLIPVIVQDVSNNDVLMHAWMNKEALVETLKTNQMCYFSRSRGKLWKKGESSGQTQELVEMTLDCDSDTLLAKVKQKGVACHTGRKSCFFKQINGDSFTIKQEVIITPEDLYGK